MPDLPPTQFSAAVVARAEGTDFGAHDFGTLAWLRRAAGDDRLPVARLAPEQLSAYAAAVRAIARDAASVEGEDPGAVLDSSRQSLLRPWEYPLDWPGPGDPDPVRVLADLVAVRPALAAAVGTRTSLEEFAAVHLKLLVCGRALILLFPEDPEAVPLHEVGAWVDRQQPRPGAEADFAASLVVAATGRDVLAAAFAA